MSFAAKPYSDAGRYVTSNSLPTSMPPLRDGNYFIRLGFDIFSNEKISLLRKPPTPLRVYSFKKGIGSNSNSVPFDNS